MGDIRDQLQTLTGASLLASQISDAGGKAFVSMNATRTQIDLTEVVEFWRGVHVPTYGVPIPSSSKSATGDASNPAVLTPGSNETAYLTAMSISNGNASDLSTVTIAIGGATVYQGACPPSSSLVVIGFQGIEPGVLLVGGQPMTITQTGLSSASELSYVLAFSLAVQG